MRSLEYKNHMTWEYQADANFKLIFSDSLKHETLEHLAARLKKVFIDLRQYNERIRTNADIPPEVKIWLVIP